MAASKFRFAIGELVISRAAVRELQLVSVKHAEEAHPFVYMVTARVHEETPAGETIVYLCGRAGQQATFREIELMRAEDYSRPQ